MSGGRKRERREFKRGVSPSFITKSSENTPQLAAGMNRRVGWQAASLGAAKQIRVAKITRICATDAPQLAGGLFTTKPPSPY